MLTKSWRSDQSGEQEDEEGENDDDEAEGEGEEDVDEDDAWWYCWRLVDDDGDGDVKLKEEGTGEVIIIYFSSFLCILWLTDRSKGKLCVSKKEDFLDFVFAIIVVMSLDSFDSSWTEALHIRLRLNAKIKNKNYWEKKTKRKDNQKSKKVKK